MTRPQPRPRQRPERGALVFAAGLVALSAVVLLAGAATPGYDPRVDTVSRLGSPGQPYAAAARLTVAGVGLLTLLVARRRPGARLVQLAGVATGVAGIVPKDPPDVPATLASQVHVAAAVSGVAALLVTMLLAATSDPRPLVRAAAALAAALVLGSAAVFPFTRGTPAYGLLQRFLLAVTAAWLLGWSAWSVGLPEHHADARAGRSALGDRVLPGALAGSAQDQQVAVAGRQAHRPAAAGGAQEEAPGAAQRHQRDDGLPPGPTDPVAVPGDAVAAVAVEVGRDRPQVDAVAP
jgi:hypothetical protein